MRVTVSSVSGSMWLTATDAAANWICGFPTSSAAMRVSVSVMVTSMLAAAPALNPVTEPAVPPPSAMVRRMTSEPSGVVSGVVGKLKVASVSPARTLMLAVGVKSVPEVASLVVPTPSDSKVTGMVSGPVGAGLMVYLTRARCPSVTRRRDSAGATTGRVGSVVRVSMSNSAALLVSRVSPPAEVGNAAIVYDTLAVVAVVTVGAVQVTVEASSLSVSSPSGSPCPPGPVESVKTIASEVPSPPSVAVMVPVVLPCAFTWTGLSSRAMNSRSSADDAHGFGVSMENPAVSSSLMVTVEVSRPPFSSVYSAPDPGCRVTVKTSLVSTMVSATTCTFPIASVTDAGYTSAATT